MKSVINLLIVLGLAVTSSAAPTVTEDATAIEQRSIEKRDILCMNKGPGQNRGDVVKIIDNYCDLLQGWKVKDGDNFVVPFNVNGGTLYVGVSGHGGCTWNIGQDCYSQLRKPLDQCNTEGENGKQGGFYDDQCATWSVTVE